MGFVMKFILDHLHEIAQAFFMKKVQPAVDAIDSCIEALRKEVANLKGRREHLLSNIGRSNHFGDQPFFFEASLIMQFPLLFSFFPSLTPLSSTLYVFYSTYLASLI